MDKSGGIDLIQNLDGSLSGISTISGELNTINILNAGLDIPIVIIPKHEQLPGRDLPNQHPISSISGLNEQLMDSLKGSDNLILNAGTSTEVIYE